MAPTCSTGGCMSHGTHVLKGGMHESWHPRAQGENTGLAHTGGKGACPAGPLTPCNTSLLAPSAPGLALPSPPSPGLGRVLGYSSPPLPGPSTTPALPPFASSFLPATLTLLTPACLPHTSHSSLPPSLLSLLPSPLSPPHSCLLSLSPSSSPCPPPLVTTASPAPHIFCDRPLRLPPSVAIQLDLAPDQTKFDPTVRDAAAQGVWGGTFHGSGFRVCGVVMGPVSHLCSHGACESGG